MRSRPGLQLGLILVLLSGGSRCQDECCNGCTRNYYMADYGIYLANVSEDGNECEIDEVPAALDEGVLYTLVVEVRSRSDGPPRSYSVDVVGHAPGDASAKLCEGMRVETSVELLGRTWD